MLVKKTLRFDEVELKYNGDTGTFTGYASVFGGVDSHGDTIRKGAFMDTLKEGMPKMFFDHVWNMPIGKYTHAEEDSKGLLMFGELTPGLAKADDVRAAMKHSTIDGLSVGGYLAKADYEKTDKGRIINKWSKLVEVSPVVFPADNSARIDLSSVKSMDFEVLLPECKTERDIERLLRDAGLGKWESMAIVTRAREIFKGRDALDDSQALILARLQAMVKT